jgi:hypothetical protein
MFDLEKDWYLKFDSISIWQACFWFCTTCAQRCFLSASISDHCDDCCWLRDYAHVVQNQKHACQIEILSNFRYQSFSRSNISEIKRFSNQHFPMFIVFKFKHWPDQTYPRWNNFNFKHVQSIKSRDHNFPRSIILEINHFRDRTLSISNKFGINQFRDQTQSYLHRVFRRKCVWTMNIEIRGESKSSVDALKLISITQF